MLWYSVYRGQEIEEFLTRLATEVPDVAIDILKVTSFGDFRNWIEDKRGDSTESWKLATCGCLVGSAALCAVKDPTVKAFVMSLEPPEQNADDILYMAWMIALGQVPPQNADGSLQMKNFRTWIRHVGQLVSQESVADYNADWEAADVDGVYSDRRYEEPFNDYVADVTERHAVLSQYFQDHLRTSLTLMGIKNLPPRIVFTSPFDE